MKINKISVLALMAAGGLLAVTPTMRGQDTPPSNPVPNTPPPRGNAANRLDKLAATLNLTDDQKAKVAAAFDENRASLRALNQDSTLTPDDKKTKRHALRQEFMANMKAILTADQFQQWQNMMHRQHPLAPPAGITNAPSSDLPPK